MKNIQLLILLLAFSVSAQAGEKVDKTLDVSATADITIEDPNSRIEIHAWDKNKVKVTGEISDQAKGYTFEKQGDNIIFAVEYEGRMDWNDSDKAKDSSKLIFYVPIKSRLEISNVNGDIDVTGIEGGTSVESVNGNIAVEKLKQRITLETINGNIVTNEIEGKINMETINGNVTDKDSSGTLKVSTVQGNIKSTSRYSIVEIEIVNGGLELQLDKIDELSIDSVNGKVDAAMDLNSKGEVSVSNVNGSIDLKFNQDVSADFQVDVAVSGAIINKLTTDKAEKQVYGPGSNLNFSKNGGSGRVEVSTVSGKVQISAR